MDYIFHLDFAALSVEQLAVVQAIGPRALINGGTLSDEQFMRMQWFIKHHEALDLEHPRTFSEKIQWLKLNDRNPLMPTIVDKLSVRTFVEKRIGQEYLNPVYYAGNGLEDVYPSSLPQRFIIKCTHGAGWNIVVRDRSEADWVTLTERVRTWLSIDYHDLWREWVYKGLPRRVTVERLLVDPSPRGLRDYKVFCFGGTPRFVQVDIGRDPNRDTPHDPNQVRAFFDTDWNRLPCTIRYPAADFEVEQPKHCERMLDAAQKLAQGFTFVRVDFFNVDGEITFGEMTFFPGNGFQTFIPPEYDLRFGEELALPRGEHGR
jgi:hypothetical protein